MLEHIDCVLCCFFLVGAVTPQEKTSVFVVSECLFFHCSSMLPPVKKDRVITQLPKVSNTLTHTQTALNVWADDACECSSVCTEGLSTRMEPQWYIYSSLKANINWNQVFSPDIHTQDVVRQMVLGRDNVSFWSFIYENALYTRPPSVSPLSPLL